ncbi:ATP-grasp domain-containing protein [Streptomyces sp. NBC_01142]|uniref:ATP-grasp domain-containing protein n=1 Tax=Streptomyces sp. NBC_01142 TaxID=2975865 RepID=UPI00225AFBB0|nr:ATP-grasp domain-containing protein [Streptomyces sp. NBC_01142]MCX4824766.1 ATP-grasp domain-containing protein [Streptomyces sp. NBC_01142]MCX4827012.1 ATP-grasp domain-containing protein [Streptomyces sp. NBC_01142]MCX4827050.1 ATP-grasp domain-containing protein [Streptomyces sp. NBC_01142]
MYVLVDPVSTGRELAAAFREEGADCLHLYEAALHAEHASDPAPHTGLLTATGPQAVAEAAELLRDKQITAVIAASERGVLLADALAHALGLPHHDVQLAAARRDKELMVRALEAESVPAARTRAISSLTELDETLDAWGAAPGTPLVVKPRNSAGSDGCTVVASRAEARAAAEATLLQPNLMGETNTDVLLQEYLEGTQYIVNTVSMDGRHLLSEVYRERIDTIAGAPVLRHIVSRPQLDDREQDLVAYVLRCLDALGIREGAAHTEVMLTTAGPRLVEVNSRVMGPSLAPDPYHAAFGYSHQHLVAERFLRPDDFAQRFELPYGGGRTLAKIFLRTFREGVLAAVDGARILRRLPGFHSIDRLPATGVPIPDPTLTTGASGIAYLVHDDEELLYSSLGFIHHLEDDGAFYRMADPGQRHDASEPLQRTAA